MSAAGAAVLLVVAEVFSALPASASCALEGPHNPLTGARVAFVGTVISTDSRRYKAIVRVESVWVGSPLPAEVEVHSDPQPALNQAIEDIPTFDQGQRYLFVPNNSTEPFKFRGCDGPQPYTQDLDQYRPSSGHSPLAVAPWILLGKQATFWISVHAPLVVAILLVVVGSVAVAARRRRRRATASPRGVGPSDGASAPKR